MATKTLYMETTEIAAERTAAEVTAELVKAGANQINTEYEKGCITGLRWCMTMGGHPVVFAMPARVDPIYQIFLKRQRTGCLSQQTKDQLMAKARRVAWRQLLRWVQAQMAMIECNMVRPEEVFLPYAQTPSGQSFFEMLEGNGMKLLEAGSEPVQ